MRIRLIFTVLIAVLLSACAPAPGPVSYLLDAEAHPTGVLSGELIGLREIDLPLYARRPQIAVLGAGGEVTLNEDNRWAEEPPRAASRHVARVLAARLNRPVVIEPWPQGVSPKVRVDIDVDYFIGSLGGELRLGGQYRLVQATAPSDAQIRSFDYVETLEGEGFGALVKGHSRALSRLSEEIARDLAATPLN